MHGNSSSKAIGGRERDPACRTCVSGQWTGDTEVRCRENEKEAKKRDRRARRTEARNVVFRRKALPDIPSFPYPLTLRQRCRIRARI